MFPINDLKFRLCRGAGSDEERVALPGADGPRPHLSSGPHRISTVTKGSFVTMEGMQYVPLTRGAWELIWRADSSCGFLICGFHLERDVRRNENGAVLPKGEFCVRRMCVYYNMCGIMLFLLMSNNILQHYISIQETSI